MLYKIQRVVRFCEISNCDIFLRKMDNEWMRLFFLENFNFNSYTFLRIFNKYSSNENWRDGIYGSRTHAFSVYSFFPTLGCDRAHVFLRNLNELFIRKIQILLYLISDFRRIHFITGIFF